jgi:hypothetical protein
MRLASLSLAILAFLLAQFGFEAAAADMAGPVAYLPPVAAGAWISELRGGLFAHGPGTREGGSVDVNGELLFVKPFAWSAPSTSFLIPRLHIGGTFNTAGDTSQLYAGFTWTYDFTSKIFVDGSVGVGFHDGKTGRIVPHDRLSLGCSPLFRESASLGYRLSENWSVMATVEHISNAGLCHKNQGLTDYGIRLGYTF